VIVTHNTHTIDVHPYASHHSACDWLIACLRAWSFPCLVACVRGCSDHRPKPPKTAPSKSAQLKSPRDLGHLYREMWSSQIPHTQVVCIPMPLIIVPAIAWLHDCVPDRSLAWWLASLIAQIIGQRHPTRRRAKAHNWNPPET